MDKDPCVLQPPALHMLIKGTDLNFHVRKLSLIALFCCESYHLFVFLSYIVNPSAILSLRNWNGKLGRHNSLRVTSENASVH